MRETICTVLGVVGGALAAAFGGWNAALTTLVFFLSLDYLTGLLVAGVFRRSPKTKTGGLQSKIGWKGLVKKVMVLLLVLAAARMDVALHTDYLRNTVMEGENSRQAALPKSNVLLFLLKDGSRVVMLRFGKNGGVGTQLQIEKGKRNLCHYETGFGSMTLGVTADEIVNELTEKGGTVRFAYLLDANSADLVSRNRLEVTVTHVN